MSQQTLNNLDSFGVQRGKLNANFTEVYGEIATEATTARAAESAAQATANAAIPATQKGAASGVASLDSGGKVPVAQLPAAVLGALNYQGTYNATTNTPALVAGNKGFYWKVATAGTSLGFTWIVGDLVIDNGTTLDKVDGVPSEVTGVGVGARTGNVTLTTADLTDLASVITGPIAANTAALSVQADNGQVGTTYTLVIGDAGNNVDMNNAAANTLTIPPHSAVAFPVGTVITVTMVGAGVTSIAAGAGVTINKPAARTLAISATLETAQLYQVSQDVWRVLCG